MLVTWQSGRDIEPCLDSIHSRHRFEVIVVDNASTDDTRARLKPYHHIVLIANKRNLGYARAVNQGLARCCGEYVLLLNPDTRITPDALDRLIELLDANPGYAAAAPRLLDPDGTLQRSVRGLPTPAAAFWDLLGLGFIFPNNRRFGHIRMRWFDYNQPGPAPQPMASCLLIRRSVLVELGGLDERFPIYYNDVDLSRRMQDRGLVTWYLPDARIIHRRGGSTGQAKPRMLREQYRSLIRFLALHDRPGRFLLKALVLVPLAGAVMFLRTLAWRLRRRRPAP